MGPPTAFWGEKGVVVTEKLSSRRNVLYGAAAAGLALPVLAACGSDSGSGTDTVGTAPEPSAPAAPSSSAAGEPAAGAIPQADIPVGGGKIFNDEKMVVTQPTEGEFKAFTAVCTHTGCLVGSVSDGSINCPCHGSKFSITDGSVQSGPASSPLAEKSVSVAGSGLTVS